MRAATSGVALQPVAMRRRARRVRSPSSTTASPCTAMSRRVATHRARASRPRSNGDATAAWAMGTRMSVRHAPSRPTTPVTSASAAHNRPIAARRSVKTRRQRRSRSVRRMVGRRLTARPSGRAPWTNAKRLAVPRRTPPAPSRVRRLPRRPTGSWSTGAGARRGVLASLPVEPRWVDTRGRRYGRTSGAKNARFPNPSSGCVNSMGTMRYPAPVRRRPACMDGLTGILLAPLG